MRRFTAPLFGLLVLAIAVTAHATPTWTEGKHYAPVAPAQRTNVPAGKVEVMEVFSYACPACAQFNPIAQRLKKSLPANAQMAYLPASFNPAEDWPVFQRAYFAAQALGVAERTHDGMFDAVWKGGELAVSDPNTHRLKNPLPSIEDVARYYARVAGVKPETFVSTANSFAVDVRMKSADDYVRAARVDSTPTIIVNGKYRVKAESLASYDELIELVNFLVAKESKPS